MQRIVVYNNFHDNNKILSV